MDICAMRWHIYSMDDKKFDEIFLKKILIIYQIICQTSEHEIIL